jgi:uncharacterized ferritin-like protein (DUF455 family)
MSDKLFERLAAAFSECDVDAKLAAVEALAADWSRGGADPGAVIAVPPVGRPRRPELVPPEALPRRKPGSVEGRAALIHAIAHIEFSAVNLALDHALRFAGMPRDYYADWIRVAAEEVLHFRLLRERLRALGHDYGDFPAHDGLWQMAEKTEHDLLARMALVPRLLEARGLDATPPIQARLQKVGDGDTARVLDVILRDEIGHVAIGDRWFRHVCAARGVEPEASYRRLIAEYAAPWPQRPLNEAARRAAGFTAAELFALGKGPGR